MRILVPVDRPWEIVGQGVDDVSVAFDGVDGGQQFGDRNTSQLGCGVGRQPRHQHEGALMRQRVRQCQGRIVGAHFDVAVVAADDIDIESAWPPTLFAHAVRRVLELVGPPQPPRAVEAGIVWPRPTTASRSSS